MFTRVIASHRAHRLDGGFVASLALHGAALGATAVIMGAGAGITNPIHEGLAFLAPLPSATRGPTAVTERLTYTALTGDDGDASREGSKSGYADGPTVGTGRQAGGQPGEQAPQEQQASLASIFDVNADSVYLSSQVDNPVAYDANSAAPIYPDSLRSAGIEGEVRAQFVVDTTGRIDVASFILLESTHGRFTESVRQALPHMIFRPAELNGHKIKQLVELPFIFRITPVHTAGVADSAGAAQPPDTASSSRLAQRPR